MQHRTLAPEHSTTANITFFLGLGAHKGGTTSMNAVLTGVEAFTSKRIFTHLVHSEPKECHFLERQPKNFTLRAYLDACWQGRCAAEHDATAVCFEIAPRYILQGTTGAMMSLLPNVKAFALLRDPIARSWSGYLQYAVKAAAGKDEPLPNFRTLAPAEIQAYKRCAARAAEWPAVQSCVLTELTRPSITALVAVRANSSLVRNFGLPVCRGLYAPQLRHLRKSFRGDLKLMLSEIYFADPIPLLLDLLAWAVPSIAGRVSTSELQLLVSRAAANKRTRNSRASVGLLAAEPPLGAEDPLSSELHDFFAPFSVALRCDFPQLAKSSFAKWLPESCPYSCTHREIGCCGFAKFL